MGASPKIYLHVGHGKVASSTIQSFLSSNADEIRRQGLLIADVNFEFPRSDPILGYPFQILLDWMANREVRREKLSEALNRVCESCLSGGYRGAIVSTEMLSSPGAAAWFGELADSFPLQVIYFVRRQEGWLESAWKQLGLKDGTSLGDFVERSLRTSAPGYLNSARAWSVAAEHLTVLPIEGVDDVQAHFAGWCGLDFSSLIRVEKANRTFDWATLDLLSRNSFLFEDVNDNRLFAFLERNLPEEAPREGHGMVPGGHAERIWSAYEEENRELRREFFPDLPECDWDRRSDHRSETGLMEQFGSIDSVFRNQAILLSLMKSLHERRVGEPDLQALADRADRIGDSITRRFNRLRSRLEREEARRLALEKRLERLEAGSIRRFFSRPLARLKALWPRKRAAAGSRSEAETDMADP